jgi:hypothetical protein
VKSISPVKDKLKGSWVSEGFPLTEEENSEWNPPRKHFVVNMRVTSQKFFECVRVVRFSMFWLKFLSFALTKRNIEDVFVRK